MTLSTATNKLNALGVFKQRNLYRDEVYPVAIPEPIDLWYERPLYGKVNNINNSVFVSEAALKQVITTNQRTIIMAVNFVADAYNDFRVAMYRSIKQVKIDVNESEFEDVDARNGWKSIHSVYHTYMGDVFNAFADVFMKEFDRDQKMLNFENFITIFKEYIDKLCLSHPFTRTSFVTSKFCPPETSGLCINIRDSDHSIDRPKSEKFIQDRNFEFYVKQARKHGFLVDKNAPWRLVADIGSPVMYEYMKPYKVTAENLFAEFYYEAFQSEISLLKIYITQFYNSYISVLPFVEIVRPSKCSQKTTLDRVYRKPVDVNRFDDIFWLKMYLYIRQKETNTDLSPVSFNKLFLNASQIYKNLDLVKSLEYIGRRMNKSNLLSVDEKKQE